MTEISSGMPPSKYKVTKATIMGLEGKGRLDNFVYHEHNDKVTLRKVRKRTDSKKGYELELPIYHHKPPRIDPHDQKAEEAYQLYLKHYKDIPEPPHSSGLDAYRTYERHYAIKPELSLSVGQEANFLNPQHYHQNGPESIRSAHSAGHGASLLNEQQLNKYPETPSPGHEAYVKREQYPDTPRPGHETYMLNQQKREQYPDTPRLGHQAYILNQQKREKFPDTPIQEMKLWF